jgi:cytochrome c oxidase subunit 3
VSTVAHTHEHPEFLRHHFDTPSQQFEAGKLGMWMFLATEVLLFGGLFCAYSIWRYNNPDLFRYGSGFLETTLGAVNTAVLILSSLTMATAVTMAQRDRRGPMVLMLALTLAGALTFLVIKYFEYTHKFHEGWFPGMKLYEKPGDHSESWSHVPAPEPQPAAPVYPALPPAGPPAEPSTVSPAAIGPAGVDPAALDGSAAAHGQESEARHARVHPARDEHRPRNAHMFFNIYFMMTGLHGCHVLGGAIMLVWLMVGAIRGRYGAAYFTPVDLGGLYWHIVDLIWIFLFPLFYLI